MLHRIDATANDNFRNDCAIFTQNRDEPLRILIADDQEVNRSVLAGLLQSLGYHPEVAENGQKAVHAWEHGNFDLILMDIHMPLIDGIEATWLIRNQEKDSGAYTPIIAHSADYAKEHADDLSCLGFDGFVRKPLDLKTLIHEIRRCLLFKRPGPFD